MMGVSGEPSGYYPMDSNGVWVQSELPAPCACLVQPQVPMVCPPLGYGGCEGGRCEGIAPTIFLIAFGVCIPPIQILPPWVKDLQSCLDWCKELDERCRRNAKLEYEKAVKRCDSNLNICLGLCKQAPFPGCENFCQSMHDLCLADALGAYQNALNQCDSGHDRCRAFCHEEFPRSQPAR